MDWTAFLPTAVAAIVAGAALLGLVAEINRAISIHLEPAATYAAILEQVGRVIPYHLAELNLWDSSKRQLRPALHSGDPDYPRLLAAVGGVYLRGEGYS